MNNHIPRERRPYSRDDDLDYRFLGYPLARKAADGTITRRRMGTSPGRHGAKSPYPPIVQNVVHRTISKNKFL